MFFDYTISNMVNEIQRQKDLQHILIIDQVPTEQQVYEFMTHFSASQLNQITYNILRPYYSKKRRAITTYIVDATPVEVDINTIKIY